MCSLLSWSQKDRHIWFFGEGAGIDFLSDSVSVRSDGMIHTLEGCTTMCDDEGNLLFFSAGGEIYDSSNFPMFSCGGGGGGYSSTNSAVSVRKPGSQRVYYVFHAQVFENTPGYDSPVSSYKRVNMDLNYGEGECEDYGEILEPSSEKIGIVPHANGTDYWIVMHALNSSTFYSYLLTTYGVSETAVLSDIGCFIAADTNGVGIGCIKATIDGSLIAVANMLEQKVELFRFDTETGILTDLINIGNYQNKDPYGVEFSIDNKFLYVSTSNLVGNSQICQYDISSYNESTINASETLIVESDFKFGALQIGPDDKIYCASAFNWHLPVIEYPGNKGDSCGYDSTKITLFPFTTCRFGLPLYIPPNKPGSTNDSIQFVMPSAFSPNDDGVNDFFIPINFSGYFNGTITIYNRWGDMLFESSDMDEGWDGRYHDEECAPGTYFWGVGCENAAGAKFHFSGYVELVR